MKNFKNFEIWTLLNLYKNFRHLNKNFIFIFILIILESLSSSISITFFIPVIDSLFNNRNDIWIYRFLPNSLIENPGKLLIFFGVIILIKALFSFGRNLYLVYFTETLRKNWQISFFKSQINLTFKELNLIPRGKIIDNVNRLPDLSSMFILNFLTYFARLSIIVFVFGAIFLINYQYVLILLFIFLLLFLLIGKKYFDLSLKYGKRSVELNQDLTSEVTNSVNGIKDLIILNAQKFKLNIIKNIATKTARLRILTKIFSALPRHILEIFLAVILIIGSIFVIINEIQLSQYFSLLIFLSGSIYIVVSNIITASTERYKVITKKYAFELLIEELKLLKKTNMNLERTTLIKNNQILFKNVYFEHSTNSSNSIKKDYEPFKLNDINLSIDQNKCTALIGPSGSGKSTLIDLTIKLYDPKNGNIFFGDKNLNEINNLDWRNKIAYVSQEPYFFNGSIIDNILVGKEDVSYNKIVDCCKMAEIHEYIMSLKDGYNSNIIDAANNISGGQKRRIAIARAIINDPFLIIIDEATSSVSEKLENKIISSLKKIHNLGILIISHRTNIFELADNVYEISNSSLKKIK